MAAQSKPNTFSGGMVTDLDPSYQSKDTYFTGLNIRVVTNGDNSYSLENVKGPELKYETNRTGASSILTGTERYIMHGAVVVNDYVIVIEKLARPGTNYWKIRKLIISSDGTLSNHDGYDSELWEGIDLFDDSAGKIEIEPIVETENIHRIYCTDGMTSLKSINVKDSDISNKTVTDFLAFKPNVKSKIDLVEYREVGGNLKYGSYSYVYRLGSVNQGNYSDWSDISRPINVVKNSLVNNTSLGVSGGSSAERSSVALEFEIQNVPQDFDQIQIAAIFYSSENVSTINIIEEGSITNSTYNFVHSGFETETLVTGGIAAAIIDNETWNVCKSLSQKDNKLYAANLKSDLFDIDSIISGYGKLRSYKGDVDGSGDWSLISDYSGDFNPHRHYNGSGGNWSWSDNLNQDKQKYKFINKNFGSSSDPVFVLGAETTGYSNENSDGFRLTFDLESYTIDNTFNKRADGTSGAPTDDQDADKLYYIENSFNSSTFGGFKKGPHNPVWDFNYRSFKRGECYRFGIVFYDKQGTPGFTHYLGDIKMPDALDPNSKVLSGTGDSATAIDKTDHAENSRWSPFSGGDTDDKVMAYALIPKIELRLPTSVTNKISGYKIVRAELTDNDKTIITQGALSTIEGYETEHGNNATLDGKAVYPPTSLTITEADSNGENNAYPARIEQKQYVIDGTDTTFRNMSYNFGSGFCVKPLYPLMANKTHNDSSSYQNHKHFGYDVKTDMDSGGQNGTGFNVKKWRPYPRVLESSTSQTTISDLETVSDENLFKWHRNVYFAKTVNSSEIVTTTQNGLSRDYIHKAPGFDGTDQFDDGDIGDFHANRYDDQSRSDYSLDVNSSLYVSTGSSGGNIPLLSQITFDSVDHKSLHQYPSSSPNNHASPVETRNGKDYRFIGFKWMVEFIRDTSSGFEQYGGTTDAAIEDTRFYDACEFKTTSSSGIYSTKIPLGDVYCDWYTLQNTSRSQTDDTYVYGSVYPIESYVNVALRQGTYLGSTKEPSMLALDNFLYNTAYSQESNLTSSVVKPTGFLDNDTFKAKIAVSQTKLLGETFDAWTVFPSNDFIELNLANGKISDLVNYKNQLFAIQDSGISFLSVNTRAIIQGEGAAADIQIVSGTGTAIERYDYITTQFGTQHFNEAILTPTGFYVFDVDKSEILKCDGRQVTPIGLSNKYKSYLTSITQNEIPVSGSGSYAIGKLEQGIFSGYDSEFRECYYSVIDGSDNKNMFVFSDLDGKLVSKLDLKHDDSSVGITFKRFMPYRNNLYGLSHENLEANRDGFYRFNESVYQDFNVGIVINDNAVISKIFDTSEIITDEPTLFTSHTLEDSTGSNATSGSNERVRENIHKVVLRGDNTNRSRGTWLKHTIAYNQIQSGGSIDSVSDKKFNIFAVNTKFRLSR